MAHNVFSLNSGDAYYVQMRGGFMEDCDYTGDGGFVQSREELEDEGTLTFVGEFTNAQIESGEYVA